jgi:predicted permease
LIGFFVMEGVVLSIAGGACGIALAVSGIEFLKHFLPAEIPRLDTALLDVRTLAFTGIAICVSALLCGVIPAVQLASRVRVGSLNEGVRSIGGPREGLRGILVVAEVAVSVVLLVSAGLLAGSYLHMRHVPLGFQPDRAVSFTVAFPWETPSANLNSFAAQALDRIGKIPGVESAGIVDRLPLHGETQSGPVVVRGQALSPSLALRSISWRTATPDYFVSAGIPMTAGAVFSADQGPSGARMALINQRLAALLFHDVNPIGQEISRKEGAAAPSWFRIAGVVSDVRQNPSDAEAQPEVYVPWGSTYWPVMNFVIRTVRPGPAIAREIRAAVQPLTTRQVIGSVAPLQDATDETEEEPRNRAWLLSCFAGAATLLAGVGIFGLLSQEVVRRTPEFGVRLALGADPRRLFWSTTLRGMRLVTAGLVIGIVLSVAATRMVQSLLPAGDAFASSSYALAGAVILLASFLASLLPGLRAAGIDPLTALRGD